MEDFTGEVVDIPLIGCDRCNENHEEVRVYPLSRPQRAEGMLLTHYGLCPHNDEPFFVAFVDDDDALIEMLAGTLKPHPNGL